MPRRRRVDRSDRLIVRHAIARTTGDGWSVIVTVSDRLRRGGRAAA
jgi:hypothetical protein